MRAGKVAGVQLILNNWFVALIVLFSFVGMGPKALGVFSAVFLHELAHAGAAALLGFKVREIELLPFGGVARIDNIGEAGPVSEILVAAAGPLASLVVAAAVFFSLSYMPKWAVTLDFYLKANLMLALFNLLPGLPLDGGRILRATLATRLDYQKATRLAAMCGKLISMLLILIMAAQFWLEGTLNLSFLLAAAFLYAAAKAESAAAGFRLMRIMARKKADLKGRGVMPSLQLTAVEDLKVRDIIKFFGPEHYYIVVVVDKHYHIKGILTETDIWEKTVTRGLYAKIGEFL